ncbi:hypothetical protein PV387_39395 [Streptomyces sp. ME02-6987-2C]|uniref:hypothetical protein n=1 Tax=unclassified Streptomyces TaxID=2593676 RepID=UPI0029BA666B|nr:MULTISPECIES: hypothetical protein [unclassified Streptomyces]MDX3345934.1 hypothetical protein [Streptomyces sp. ME02-6979A]MDX3371984.1 hypothetical protein [Streptomyces sp. ME02-6987-2C]MDX3412206.1 hypothetical protein [Streptomyces sp. ME02-6977A]MDX3421700.1 hypothetical protein [Streptomyces sp. ME02-6985-2c]
MSPATFTASIERLGDLLAASYEDGVQRLTDLPHTEAARYRGIAAELVSRCLPRDEWALAMVLALLVERRHHEAISTVQFARHVDTADNVLRHF